MKAYLEIVEKVLSKGVVKHNRTGVDAITVPGAMFEHDMKDGFPLVTTKKMPFRLIASELEFFIKGITDKDWLRNRNNHIWDEWCSPDRVAYGHDPETKARMMAEPELGPIYGWQWRNFGAQYVDKDSPAQGVGVDQLARLVDKLKSDPGDRRMIVTAWNPVDLPHMALPPCHYSFQITVINGRLNLLWNQRSVDVGLGLPFNIASYGLLLHLLALEAGLEEGTLVGFLGDTHIYQNHVEGLKLQIAREPFALPAIRTSDFKSIFTWENGQSRTEGYKSHDRIDFEIAV